MAGLPLPSLVQYRDPLFTVNVTKDITYNTNTQVGSNTLDLYQPGPYAFTGPTWAAGDSIPAGTRPLFIFFHGGSFYLGTKRNQEAKVICEDMASRGFNAISCDYFKFSQYSWGNSEVAATCDMRAAIRWAKNNAGTYNINSAKICVAGESAGGCAALFSAISDFEFDNGNNYAAYNGANSRPNCIVSCWGKVQNTSFDLNAAPYTTNIAAGRADNLIVAHGTADIPVPYADALAIKSLVDSLSGTNKMSLVTLRDAGHSPWKRLPVAIPPRFYADGYYEDAHQTVVNYVKLKLAL